MFLTENLLNSKKHMRKREERRDLARERYEMAKGKEDIGAMKRYSSQLDKIR